MAKQLNSYQVNLQFTANAKSAQNQIRDLQFQLDNLLKSSINEVQTQKLPITKELTEAQIAASKLQTILSQTVNIKTGKMDLTKFSQSLRQSNLNLEKLQSNLMELGPEGQKAFMALSQSIIEADVPLKRTSALVSEMWTVMKNTARWQISSSAIHSFTGAVQTAYHYAQDLNESLNNIRIVTGQSTDQMAKFAKQANTAAKALSTTTTEYTDAALIYYQQGLNDEQVKERTDISIKMANVARESAEIVSDQMTAVWNNFYDGSQSLEHYADAMVRLGADTASSSDEIAGGLEKFAAVANTIGLSFDNAAAALATITATTRQSEDVVGTALKTIFARIQGLKLGETLEDGTTLNQYSQALEKVGINIKDSNGELKDMDNIIEEMGNKWQSIDKDQQVALAQQVAGVRQYTQLIALMDHFDYYKENLARAQSADGSLQKQADIYAESWEAASNRVKAAAQGVYAELINDKFFITLNDLLADVLDKINDLIKSMGGLPGVIAAVGIIFTKVFNKQIAQGLSNVGFGIQSLVGYTKRSAEQMKEEAYTRASNMAFDNVTEADAVSGEQLKYTLELKKEIQKISGDITSQEREQLENLIKINQAYGDQVIKAAQAKDQVTKELQSINTNLRSIIRNDSQSGSIEDNLKSYSQIRQSLNGVVDTGYQGAAALNTINEKIGTLKNKSTELHAEFEILAKALDQVHLTKSAKAVRNLSSRFESGKLDVKAFRKEFEKLENVNAGDLLSDTAIEVSARVQFLEEQFGITGKAAKEFDHLTEALGNTLLKLKEKIEIVKKGNEGLHKQFVEIKSAISGYQSALNDFGKSITQSFTALSSLAMGLMSLKGAIDTLQDEDMSIGDKLLSVTMSLSMALVSLTSAVNQFKQAELKKTAAQLKSTAQTLLETIAINANTAAGKGKVVITKKMTLAEIQAALASTKFANSLLIQTAALLAAKMGISLVAAMALIAVGVFVALAGAVALIAIRFKKMQESTPEAKLKKLEENAKASSEAFDKLNNNIDETNSALEKLQSYKDTIGNLVPGTIEWYKAISDVNAEITKLLEKYPELSKYISADENGAMDISDEGRKYLEESQKENLKVVTATKIKDQIALNNQQIENSYSSFKDTSRGLGIVASTLGGSNLTKTQLNEIIQNAADNPSFGNMIYTKEGANELLNAIADTTGAGIENVKEDTVEAFYQSILENKDQITKNSSLKEQGKLLYNNLLEAEFSALGSDRTADEINDLFNGEDIYSQTVADQKSKLQKDFKWNKHINYSGNEQEIQDYMQLLKQQGYEDISYVAQRNGNMILKVDDEELKVSADQFYSQLAEAYSSPEVAEKFTTALQNTLQKSLNGIDLSNLDLNQLNYLDSFQRSLQESFGDTELGTKYFNKIIKAYGTSEEDLQNFSESIKYIDKQSEAYQRLIQQLAGGQVTIDEFKDGLKDLNAIGELNSMSDFFTTAGKEMGLSDDEVQSMKDYASYILEVSKNSSEFDDSVSQDANAAARLAVQITRMNKGVETLSGNFETWNDILKNSTKGSQEYFNALTKTRSALSDVLDVEEEFISDDFVISHLDEIAKAAKGDEKAIDSLRSSMDEEIIARITLGQDEEFTAQINSLDQKVKDACSKLDPTIEVGAKVNDADFLEAANNLVKESQMTADEANAYFAGIGYEPVYNAEDIDTSAEMPNAETITRVVDTKFDNPKTFDLGFLGKHTINLPSITTKTETKAEEPTKSPGDMRLVSFSGGKTPPKIRGFRRKATGSSNNHSSTNSGGSGGGKKSSGGSSSSKSSKIDKSKKSDVVDRYKEITDSINDTTRALDKANKSADRLWGKAHLDAMAKSNKLTLKEVDLLKQKQKEAQAYLKTDKATLQQAAKKAGITFTFDEDGDISNYTDQMTKLYNQLVAAQDKANSFSTKDAQDAYKEATLDPIQKKIDELKDAISQYEDTRDLVEELTDNIQDKINEWQDKNYQMLNYEVEVKIQLDENDTKKLEYYFDKLSDNIYKAAEALGYLQGQFDPVISQLGTYENFYGQLNNAYSNGEISQENYIEGLQDVYDNTLDNLNALQDLDKEMLEYYGNTIDLANDELSKYTDHMEHLTSVLDHYRSIITLLGKDKDYDKVLSVLNGTAQTKKNNFDASKQWYESLKRERDAAAAALASSTDEAEREVLQKNYDAILAAFDEAEEDMLSKAEEYGEALKEILTTKMEQAADEMNKQLSTTKVSINGNNFNISGWDALNDALDRMSSYQDEYLTKTNQIYEMNKLLNNVNQAIDKTNNQAAKNRYQQFTKEIEQLRDKDKLSQLELEIAQAKYKVLEAQIALEEAQNAKSTVRLQRDNEGNFGYVYTADQEKVNDAQQALADAENDLYNIRLDATNKYGQQKLQYEKELAEKLAELDQKAAEDAVYRETTYQQERALVIQQYTDLITTAGNLYAKAQEEDNRVVQDAWVNSFDIIKDNSNSWKDTITENTNIINDTFKEWQDSMDEISKIVGDDLKDTQQKVKDVTDESNKLYQEVSNKVIPALESELSSVRSATEAWAQHRQQLLDTIRAYEELLDAIQATLRAQSGFGSGSSSGNDSDWSKDMGNVAYGSDDYYKYMQNREDKINGGYDVGAATNARVDAFYRKGLTLPITRNGQTYRYFTDIPDSVWKQLVGFRSGGYTGTWNDDGKLAFLHQKELVLNADDTENMLASIQLVRQIAKQLDFNSQQISTLSSSGFTVSSQDGTLEQNVRIEANFPNATDRYEIQEAFNTLVNVASQYANRK